MIHDNIEQRSPEWYALRLGKVTGSRVDAVMAKGKGSAPSTTRRNYLAELACERLTGKPTPDKFFNGDMQRGIDLEGAARECYEFKSGLFVRQVAFITHAHIPNCGISPDGLVGDDGGVEIKCPIPAIHQNLLLGEDDIDAGYVKQMQLAMACTGRKWWDFVSYCPDMPEDLQIWIKRIVRDSEMIKEMETAIILFLREVDERVARLRALCE